MTAVEKAFWWRPPFEQLQTLVVVAAHCVQFQFKFLVAHPGLKAPLLTVPASEVERQVRPFALLARAARDRTRLTALSSTHDGPDRRYRGARPPTQEVDLIYGSTYITAQ